jgi:hypothetical protein
MRQVLALLILIVAPTAQASEAVLTDASVRAFVNRQEAAWNAKDARAFAATFTAEAQFVAQARDSHGGLTSNGRSTVAQATAQARRFFAKSRFHETGVIDRVIIAPDGRTAQVLGHVTTQIETPGRTPQKLCAETLQTVTLGKGRMLSQGQTETDVRCPR